MLAADEVWRLQGGRDSLTYRRAGGGDPECLSFQKMAAQGHYGSGPGTKQGIYVCTSTGEFLASINSTSPGEVVEMLRRGLEAWSSLAKEKRVGESLSARPSHRWESSYPEDGLVLTQTFRHFTPTTDFGLQPGPTFNLDYAWFSGEEASHFLSKSPVEGQKYKVPQRLYRRLARHHLLNSVHGESGNFDSDQVEGELQVEVQSVGNNKVCLKITGTSDAHYETKKETSWWPRRIQAEILGYATYDRERSRFVHFELIAIGTVTPHSQDEEEPPALKSIGWHFSLAPQDEPSARLAPTYLFAYDADWVKKPKFQLHALPDIAH